MKHPITWLEHAGQRLGLVPSLGGGVAAWQLRRGTTWHDLWRPWDGASEDRYTLASFAMLPWSNRISHGGFEQDGHFYAMAPNRAGEPYPIHGDGWLQAWTIEQPAPDTLSMQLESKHFDGSPYAFRAVQTFTLVDGGLDQRVSVTHLGEQPLPHGLGLHPWFPRTPGTRITAPVQGVWLCGGDPLPTEHTTKIPADWNLSQGAPAHGSFIDNGYTGWTREARIDWPEHSLSVTLREPPVAGAANAEGYCLVYRPQAGPAFCFEPISHPIDAFHLPGRPGLRVLGQGESLSMQAHWRVQAMST